MTITNQHNYLKIYMDSRATSPHDCYHAALTNFISCWTTGVLILRNPKLFQPQFGRCVVWRTEGFFCFCFVFYCKYHTCIVEIKRSINFYLSSYARKSVYLPTPLSHTPSITVKLFDHLTIIQC